MDIKQNKITVFVGDADESLANAAKEFDKNSFLVDRSNYKKFLSGKFGDNITVFTSLADLPKITKKHNPLLLILEKADVIFYHPPKVWNDYQSTFTWTTQKDLTEYYLLRIKNSTNKTINGLKFIDLTFTDNYLELINLRKTSLPVVWVVGGSDTHGVGVNESERYGNLVAEKLNKQAIFLTRPAASIEFCADQIIRSNVHKDDIVIWGLVPVQRMIKVNNYRVLTLTPESIENVELLDNEERLYKAVTCVDQVINFCKNVGCKLVILPLDSHPTHKLWNFAQSKESFCYHSEEPLDLAKDNMHPGPKHHKYLSELILSKLLELNT